MATCPTKQAFIEDLESQFELSRDEKIKLSKMYDRLMILKDEVDEDLVLGDDAMKNYKPKTVTGSDVTKRFTDIIGNQVAVNYNEAKAVDRMVSKVIDMGDYVNVVLENDGKYESYKFADGEATGVSAKGTKVTIDRMDKFTSFVLGNKKDDSNWDNLVKDETYIHGDTESMLKMLDTLHEMGGKKATDENMEYYRKLLRAMDPKFFKKMALFMKNTSQNSGGWVDGNSLYFKASKSKMLAGNQQTEAEIYLHEVVHTMTKFARLSGTAEARAIDRELEHAMAEMKKRTTWKNFLPAVSIDAKLEEKIAKEMYAYVFTSENAVDEFIAHVLTNPIVKSVAEKIMIQKDNKATSLLDKVLSIFKSLVGVVMGNYAFNEKDKNVYTQVLNLATQLGEINNRAEAKKREHDNLLSTANNLLNSVDAKISRKLNELKDKWIVDDGERLEDYPSTANRFVKGKWLFKLLKKAVVNENYGKVLGLFASAYGIKPTGIIRNVLADFTEPTAYEKAVEWLQLESDKIEGARNTVISAGKKQVLDGFKKKLNAAEERALLRTIVDLDMAILFEGAANGKVYASHYNMPEIHRLLTDEAYLEKEIGKAKHRLKVAGGMKYYNWYKNQAVGLGYYLATGKANIAQNFNAVNIARGLGSTEYHTFDATTAREIDVLATLVGIQNTGVYEREIAANIIKNEKTGVINLMQMHKGYNEEAKKVLFDNNSTQMIKGYSKELFDDTLEVQIAPLSEREEMELSGFKFKGELKGKYGDKTETPMAMYISSSFGRNEWLRGATRLVGSGSRGTTVSDTKYADMGDFARERAARDIARLDVERLKLVQKQMDGEFLTSELEYGLAPVYNANGDVVNYRYMMDKNTKEDLLKQDTSVSETIGRTFGSMLDRANSKKHNKKVLKDILDNMDKNWTSGTLGNDLVTEYVVITPNAHDKKIKELYRILPKEFKDAMNERADKSLAVPANMQDLYFGYRHLSIVDLPGFQRLMPKIIVELTRYAEAMWMELVKIAKTNILLKLPTVLLKNIISNFIQSVNRGVGLVTAFKLHLESFRDVRAYIKKSRELAKLELEMKTGKVKDATAERIKMIKADLKRNPVHELMSRGMYQAFQEDAENADLRGSNKLKKMMDKKLSMAPSFVRTPLQWLYLSEETAVYKMMQEVLQMSDLVFRDVANRAAKIQEKNQADGKEDLPEWFLKENPGKPRRKLEGKERAKFLAEAREFNLYDILEMAINYNKPPSSMEAYLNRIGPVRFTSYLKRIQKVAKKTTLEHPVRSALVALVSNYIDADTIQAQIGKGIPLYTPMDTLKDVATPSLIRYIDDII